MTKEEARLDRIRRSMMKWRKKQKTLGLCISCTKPAINKNYCPFHKKAARARQRASERQKCGIPVNAPLYSFYGGKPRKPVNNL